MSDIYEQVLDFLHTLPIPGNSSGLNVFSTLASGINDQLSRARARFSKSAGVCNTFAQSFLLAPDSFPEDLSGELIHFPSEQADDLVDSLTAIANFMSGGSHIVINASNGYVFDLDVVILSDGAEIWCCDENGDHMSDGRLLWYDTSDGNAVLNPVVTDVKGRQGMLVDLIADQQENAGICDALSTLISGVTAQSSTAADIQAIIGAIDDRWDSVKTLVSQAWAGFLEGGFYGLISVILRYIQGPAGMTYDSEEQILTMTDNSAFLPKAYACSILDVISGSMSSLAAIIVNAFGPIAAGISVAISSIFCSIPKMVNYQYDTETLASLIDDLSSCPAMAPFGGSYGVMDVTDYFPGAEFNGRQIVDVPGGFLITLNSGSKFSYEFHPSLVDNRQFLSLLVTVTDQLYSRVKVKIRFPLGVSRFMDLWAQYTPQGHTFTNGSSGTLSAQDDEEMLKIIMANCLIFWIFINCPSTQLGNKTLYLIDTYPPSTMNTLCSWDDDEYHDAPGSPSSDGSILVHRIHHCAGYALQGLHGNASDMWSWCPNVLTSMNNVGYPGYEVQNRLIAGCMDASSILTALRHVTTFYSVVSAPQTITWAIQTPKFNRGTFWANVATCVIAGVAITTVVGLATWRMSRAISKKQAQLKARAEKAWADLGSNPTDANYKAYKKAVFKNNLLAFFSGGTKLSKNDYWGTDSSGSILSPVMEKANNLVPTSENSLNPNNVDLNYIKRLIIGDNDIPNPNVLNKGL